MTSSTTTLSKGKIHDWYNSSADASIGTAHAAKDKGYIIPNNSIEAINNLLCLPLAPLENINEKFQGSRVKVHGIPRVYAKI